jgi:DNA mismatch repair ATPase MutS
MCGKESANMKKCGVPMHSFRKWAVRFVCLGITVGRVDQVRQ